MIKNVTDKIVYIGVDDTDIDLFESQYVVPNGVSYNSYVSEFFREWYINGDLGHYLDNYSDYVVYEAETTGEWNLGDMNIFSIAGNSFRQNKYSLNGMRIDSRYQVGSTMLYTNMLRTDYVLDYHEGKIHFTDAAYQSQSLTLKGNAGNLGGISPGNPRRHQRQHHRGHHRHQFFPESKTQGPGDGCLARRAFCLRHRHHGLLQPPHCRSHRNHEPFHQRHRIARPDCCVHGPRRVQEGAGLRGVCRRRPWAGHPEAHGA